MHKILLIGMVIGSWGISLAQIPVNEKESSHFLYYFDKGEELLREKNYPEAIRYYNECLNLYPYYKEAYYSRANAKEKLNDIDGAITDYNILLELSPDQNDALFSRGMLFFRQEKWERALHDFKKLVTLPLGETSSVFFQQDLYSSAVNQVFTTQSSGKAYLYNYLGLTAMGLQQYDSAIYYLDSALLLNPNEADYYVNKGKCYEALDRPEEARTAYRMALALNPDHSVAQHNLSVLNRRSGAIEEADQLLEEVIAKNPTLPYPYAERAFNELSRGNTKKALADYNMAITLSPDDPEYRLNRGMVKEELRDWEGAYADFSKAIALNEKLEKAWFNRANLLFKLKRYEEAAEDYDVTLFLYAEYGAAYYNRALVRERLNRRAEACEDLKKANTLGMEVPLKLMNRICGLP